MKGFAERVEEIEKFTALSGFQIDLNGTRIVFLKHSFIVYASEARFRRLRFQSALQFRKVSNGIDKT
jgi:hypothetical protein